MPYSFVPKFILQRLGTTPDPSHSIIIIPLTRMKNKKPMVELGWLKKINAGRTADVFEYGNRKVLKLYRTTVPKKAIEEEFRIGLILNDVGLDIAKTYEMAEFEGALGIIFEYIDGATMLQNLAKKPWLVFSYSKQMAKSHWEIHKTHLSVHDMPSLKESLIDGILTTPLLTKEEKGIIISHLLTLKDRRAICHGDFHPDNIIISKNGLVTVDWMTARVGNSIADVARTWLSLTMGTLPENKSGIEVFLTKCLRNAFYHSYIKEYKKLSKITDSGFEDWKLPVAAARLLENVSEQENQHLLNFIRSKLSRN
jgi:serine/threonine protein kinase